MDRATDRELTEQLLMDWYRWSRSWRPALGAPRVSPYCRQSRTSRQYDEDAGFDRVFLHEMETVDWCVGELPLPLQQAIGIEMRNREVKARVWRSSQPVGYGEALIAVTRLLELRGILRGMS